MFDLSTGSSYIGDANYINVFNIKTFYQTTLPIKIDNIISYIDFNNKITNALIKNFRSNSLNMYYTESNTRLGYWFVDSSLNIKYNNDIEGQDISTIPFTTSTNDLFGLGLSLSNFHVSAFNDNFAFTDLSNNLIFYTKNEFHGLIDIIAIPTNFSSIEDYGVNSNSNFIIQGKHKGDAIFSGITNNDYNKIYFFRFNLNDNNLNPNLVHTKTINGSSDFFTSMSNSQKYIYNISTNGDYLAYFNNEGFLEIYKFNGTTYNLYKTKRDKSYLDTLSVTFIGSINSDGTIISLLTFNLSDQAFELTSSKFEIFRIN